MDRFNFLTQIETEKLLSDYIEPINLKKGQILISQGQYLDKIYDVRKGLLREYHQDEENEFTASFILENNFYLAGFFLGQKVKSSFTVEALEDSRLESIGFGFFEALASRPNLLLEFGELISLKKYHQDIDWKLINGKRTFLEKWEYFNLRFPGLWLRIPQKCLASFFNVTPQYISKLKATRKL